MNITTISPDTRVKKIGMPGFFQGKNGKAVLALHGFTGVADNLRYLSKRLNEAGYTVSMPRLPGHGTDKYDFRTTGRRDWLRRAVDAYLELRSEYEEVFVTGSSMGGLLTLLIASMFEVPKIALAAPAIYNSNRMIALTPLLRFFIKETSSSYDEVQEDPERDFIADQYWRKRQVRQVYELYRLQGLTKKRLPMVHADTLIFVSQGDDTVPVQAAAIIERGIRSEKKKRIELEKSPHVLVNDIDREMVAGEIIAWFSGESSV